MRLGFWRNLRVEMARLFQLPILPTSKALDLTNQAVVEALDGLPAHKLHCSVLAEQAVKSAIEDYYNKKQK